MGRSKDLNLAALAHVAACVADDWKVAQTVCCPARRPALQALRMIVSLAPTRDGRHRQRSIVFYDIVASFVHASIDEVVGVVFQEACWRVESDSCC